ncbi:hypothetical protein [Burkholderia sp. Bp9031]|uniref:hypothetical protein n=1 Tax=Burkholderia sp. Bp9031 TaxID=2184566 RepID=UPI0016399ADC|nr:hypothetical protein [Burkholderia sp. Bp9031]
MMNSGWARFSGLNRVEAEGPQQRLEFWAFSRFDEKYQSAARRLFLLQPSTG